MMKKRLVNGLNTDKITHFFGLTLAIFLAIGGFLYWQGYIQELGLILLGIITIVVGISFILGVRVSQKDGFLDGYVRAKDNFNKKKK